MVFYIVIKNLGESPRKLIGVYHLWNGFLTLLLGFVDFNSFSFWILLSCLLSLEHTWYPMQQLQSVGQCLGSCINIVLFFYYCFMYIDYVLKINQYIMCFISYHLSVCYKFYYKIIVSIYLSFYQNIGLDFYSIIKKEEKNTLLLI